MYWYSVSLLFRAIHNGVASDTDIWEERIILVSANTEENAKEEALKIGRSEEVEYFAPSDNGGENQAITWKFVQIERICAIEGNTLSNGLEIFCRYLRNSEVESILTPFD